MERKLYLSISFIFLLFTAYYIQTKMLLTGDVGYLVNITGQFLSGKKYGDNFFETNPPMILYLYSPIFLISKWFGANIIEAVRIYVFLLAIISFSFCNFLINKIIPDKFVLYTFLITLFFTFFILPVDEFGQREHLFLLLTMPYMFAAILNSKPTWLAILIGLMAGLGFAIKPFFLVPLVLIECYLIIVKRNIFGWVRIESIICGLVLIVYLISVYLFQPNYIHVLLPLISKYYFNGVAQSWSYILNQFLVVFCILPAIYYILFQDKKIYPELHHLLLLALIGNMIAFLIPRAAWYYHLMPAFAMAFLIIVLMLTAKPLASGNSGILAKLNLLFFGCLIFFLPITDIYLRFTTKVNYQYINEVTTLISYIDSKKTTPSIDCFSIATTNDCFPLVYLTHANYEGRFPILWWLSSVLRQKPSEQLNHDKNYFIDKIAENLEQNKTKIIIINTSDLARRIDSKFSLIDYFSKNDHFKQAWKHYRYTTQIGRYQVYERIGV